MNGIVYDPEVRLASDEIVTVACEVAIPVIVKAAAAALFDATVTLLPRVTVPRARSFVLTMVSAAVTFAVTFADALCPNDRDETISKRTATRIRFFIVKFLLFVRI